MLSAKPARLNLPNNMTQKLTVYPPNPDFPVEIAIYVAVVIVLTILALVFISAIGSFLVALVGTFFGAAAKQVLGKNI